MSPIQTHINHLSVSSYITGNSPETEKSKFQQHTETLKLIFDTLKDLKKMIEEDNHSKSSEDLS